MVNEPEQPEVKPEPVRFEVVEASNGATAKPEVKIKTSALLSQLRKAQKAA